MLELTSAADAQAEIPAEIGALALSGRLDEARSSLAAFLREAEDTEQRTQARFFVVAGLCHAGQAGQALRLVRSSLEDLPGSDTRTRFWIWQGLAIVRYFQGRFDRARAAGRRALGSAVQASFPYARVLALDLLAHILVHTGDLHAGLRLLSQAADLAETLGYASNTVTLRTSAVVHELEYLLRDIDAGIAAVTAALERVEVSYFTKRSGLIVLAKAWALKGDAVRARAALAEARRIALPGSDRRGKSRWLGGQALVTALSAGRDAARPILEEARRAADGHAPLLAELAFIGTLFVAEPDMDEVRVLAEATGMARARVAEAWARGIERPPAATAEDGLCRTLLRCGAVSPFARLEILVEEGLLGLVPWALGSEPGLRLILLGERMISEHRGDVTLGPAPPGPSRRVLTALATGYRSREELAETVWGLGRYLPHKHSAVINTAISRLRGSLAEPGWIVTDDDGYHLAPGVEVVAPATPISTDAAEPPPSDEEATLLRLLAQRSCSSADAARALGVSPSSALRVLRRMVDDGRVRRLGSGRATRYELIAHETGG